MAIKTIEQSRELTKSDAETDERPRLPFSPSIEKRFGIDHSGWTTLVGAVFPSAKTVQAVLMALSYCRRFGLDPFKKVVHIVPMWSKEAGGYVETVWPGIALLRTVAFRTEAYVGIDLPVFGPKITAEFTGKVSYYEKGKFAGKRDETVTVSYPEWCQYTVHRLDKLGAVRKFAGPRVYWMEAYASRENTDLPNEMWQSRPEGQLDKCAEAAALRRAFPEELGTELASEEMYGRVVIGDVPIAASAEPAKERPKTPDIPIETTAGQQVSIEEKVAEVKAAAGETALSQVGQGYVNWFSNTKTLADLKQAVDTAEADPQTTDDDRVLLRDYIRSARTRIKATPINPQDYAGGMVKRDDAVDVGEDGRPLDDAQRAEEAEADTPQDSALSQQPSATSPKTQATPGQPAGTAVTASPSDVPGTEGGKIKKYSVFKKYVEELYKNATSADAVAATYANVVLKYIGEYSPEAQKADQEMIRDFYLKRLDAP